MNKINIDIPKEKIAEFCKRNHIRRLSLFGSVLSGDFGPDSDIDFLDYDINLDILWQTVTEDLSPLISELEKIVPPEKKS